MVTNFTTVYKFYKPGNEIYNPTILYYKNHKFGNFYSCNYKLRFVKCVVRKLFQYLQYSLACML
jgi:hypothetical protein